VQVQRASAPGRGIAIGETAAVTITELSANSLFGTLAGAPGHDVRLAKTGG
jgi:hypothetical protein